MGFRDVAAGIALLAGLMPASAEDYSLNVQNLYHDCEAPERTPANILCLGYISGIGNMMQLVGGAEKQHPDENYTMLGICGSPSNGAMVQAFVNWAQKNPREWGEPQFGGVVSALNETWPCR